MPAHFKTPLVPTTATAIHPSFQANLDNPHEFGDLMDESAKLRARIAERPAKRERLEALLLHVCIRQAEHVSELQDRRDDLMYLEQKDPVYGAEGMTQNNQRIESDAATLAKLVRVYRLFIHAVDPADFAGLFNPFLDWLSAHRADDRPQIEAAIEEFVTNLPIR
jgi:hypothetical protein